MKTFQSIKYWIFDLDNTLYSGDTKVFEQVSNKMTKYVSNKLNVDLSKAKKIQTNYFHKYNTTLNGLIKNHKIDANDFLDFVHDIDIDFLKKDLKLNKELEKLDGKKIIFTNGSKKHALNITQKIGIDHHFDDFFDIIPEETVFIEDIAKNLEPAKKLGMKTVWLINDEFWGKKDSDKNHIDLKIKNLSSFLKEINILKAT